MQDVLSGSPELFSPGGLSTWSQSLRNMQKYRVSFEKDEQQGKGHNTTNHDLSSKITLLLNAQRHIELQTKSYTDTHTHTPAHRPRKNMNEPQDVGFY